MFRHSTKVRGLTIRAKEGDLGKVEDTLFDDVSWAIRYFVLSTGGWLSGRQVLISPAAVEGPDWDNHSLHVNLTQQQIEKSPDISSDEPVSRQLEQRLHEHYGWPMYWTPKAGVVMGATPPGAARPDLTPGIAARQDQETSNLPGDPHLRSMREVVGYHVQATDGEVGHVEDFVVDHERWLIRFLIIDTRNWLPGRKVLVAPDWLKAVDWAARHVHVDLTCQAIKDSPPFEPNEPVNEKYAGELHDYYGRPNRWSAASAAPVHW